ncbi:hypothetical protein Leryth_021818 [Lithospermum erythrorhizon]|nr:hypothetical protein Leryth_021818 [Lithospermum erythrorhizon]
MKCVSCKEEYTSEDAGTCRDCYDEAGETEEELKREIDDLKAKLNFLTTTTSSSSYSTASSPWLCFSDVVLVASTYEDASTPIPAHRAVLLTSLFPSNPFSSYSIFTFYLISSNHFFLKLTFLFYLASRSPVFKAMLENDMEESLSRTIKIIDVSYDALRAFICYLYTAEACLDEPMACDLLVLADKYQVKHLKTYCEKFLITKLNWENALLNYAFAHQHNAKSLLDASLVVIMENMDKLNKREEYKQLVDKDPQVVVEIYEAYVSKQANTAALKDSPNL